MTNPTPQSPNPEDEARRKAQLQKQREQERQRQLEQQRSAAQPSNGDSKTPAASGKSAEAPSTPSSRPKAAGSPAAASSGNASNAGAAPKKPAAAASSSNTRGGSPKIRVPKRTVSTHVPDPRLAALETEEEETTLIEQIKEEGLRAVPAYLGSLVVHLILLIALGLIVLPQLTKERLNLEFGFSEPTPEIAEFEIDGSDSVDTSPPPLFDATMLDVEIPQPDVPPLTVRPEGVTVDDPIANITLRTAISGRGDSDRERLLQELGGTPGTQDAVREGLEWLKRNQQRDGLWQLTGPYADGTNLENRSAATALALLCFLGAGHTHQSGEYQDVVRKGLLALLERQQFDGDFYRIDGTQIEIANHHLYTHAQGMIVVCEALAMTGDESLVEPATKAVQFAEKYQTPEGGWRYTLGVDADLSVTGWFVLGLQSAKMAGIPVQEKTWEGIDRFLYRVEHEDHIRFVYKRNDEPTLAMTAEGVLCRQYLGWKRDEPQLNDAVAYLGANPINFDAKDYYYWYYASQVMRNMEGDAWKQWNEVMREEIPKNQVRDGRERGSWEPFGDRYSMSGGGRMYSTCLMILTLEVYYRHLPIYRYKLD